MDSITYYDVVDDGRNQKMVGLTRIKPTETVYIANYKWKFTVTNGVVSIERRRPDRILPIICDIEIRAFDADGGFETYEYENVEFKKLTKISELRPWDGYCGQTYTIDKDWKQIDIDIHVKSIDGKKYDFDAYERELPSDGNIMAVTQNNKRILINKHYMIKHVPYFASLFKSSPEYNNSTMFPLPMNYDEFLEFLRSVYPGKKQSTLENFVIVSKMENICLGETREVTEQVYQDLPTSWKLFVADQIRMGNNYSVARAMDTTYTTIMRSLQTPLEVFQLKEEMRKSELLNTRIEADLDDRHRRIEYFANSLHDFI